MSAERLRSDDLGAGADEGRGLEQRLNGAPPDVPLSSDPPALPDGTTEESEEITEPEASAAEAEEEAPPAPKKERRWLRSSAAKAEKAAKAQKAAEAQKAAKAAKAEESAESAPASKEADEDEAADGEDGGKRSRLRWKKKEMPAGLFIKCEACSATIYRKELVGKGMVCPDCGFHFTLGGRERIEMLLDEGSWHEVFAEITSLDRLEFTDTIAYAEKIERTVTRTGQKEALLLGTGSIAEHPVVLAVLDFKFMGGSMGEVVGEKIALGAELALERRLPLVIFTSSGGARMHEGMLSLMQMAKTCAALQTMRERGGMSICVMTNPTTGGVTASFASVCDIVLAEPGALIGFAGPRVIATTLKQELPKGFQRAEFLLEKGQIDAIVLRNELRDTLARLIDFGEGAWK